MLLNLILGNLVVGSYLSPYGDPTCTSYPSLSSYSNPFRQPYKADFMMHVATFQRYALELTGEVKYVDDDNLYCPF